MAPNTNYDEILTHTIEDRSKALADNVTENIFLLKRLREKGNTKLVSGGTKLLQELEYAENSAFGYYSGDETLATTRNEIATAAEFAWKQAAVPVIIDGLEQIKNSGPEQMIDLLESRVKNAEKTMMNNIGAGVYADGTGSGGKEIGGLQLLLADANTNTVGNISGTTYSWWRHIVYDASSDGGAAVDTSNIQDYMNAVYVQLVRNRDFPDLIVADNNYWLAYLGSLQAIQRITEIGKPGQAGYRSLKYMDADVICDGGVGGSCPTNHMYFLNTDYIFFKTHRDRNFVPLGGNRQPVNQDIIVKFTFWAGNMTISNRRMHGLIKA